MVEQNSNGNNEIKNDNTSEITPVETNTEENLETEIKDENKIEGVSGKDSFISIVIDQAISLGISAVLLVVVNLIMQPLGWYISNRQGMFIIFFVIVNVIYNAVMHASKSSNTFGEKVAHLKVTK